MTKTYQWIVCFASDIRNCPFVSHRQLEDGWHHCITIKKRKRQTGSDKEFHPCLECGILTRNEHLCSYCQYEKE